MGFRFLINFNRMSKSCTSRITSSSSSHSAVYSGIARKSGVVLSPNYLGEGSSSENPNFKIQRRWHVGHSHQHDGGKEGEKIFRLGLVADIGLAAGKAVTGYLSGSTAIIADAAHSVSDVVLSAVALLSFKAAMVPKDKEHPYGHL